MIDTKKLNITFSRGGTVIEAGRRAPLHILSCEGLESSNIDLQLSANAQGDGGTVTVDRYDSKPITMVLEVDREEDSEAWYEKLRRFFVPHVDTTITVDNCGRQTTNTFRLSKFRQQRTNLYEPFRFLLDMICPDPYMKSVSEYVSNMADHLALFTAPFALYPNGGALSVRRFNEELLIVNRGDVDTGIIFEFSASGPVKNPRIDNLTTGEFLRVVVDMAAGDALVINTQRGKHAITLNGVSVTQKKDRDQNCRFFQLVVGENVLKYSADDGYANLSVVPRHRYEYYGG